MTAIGVSEDAAGVTTDTSFTEFNVGASVVLCLAGCWAGIVLGRLI